MPGSPSNTKTRRIKGSKRPSRRALVLLSGGLDSTTALALYVAQGYQVRSIFFDYGQPAAEVERKAAKRNSAKYGTGDHVEIRLDGDLFKSKGSYFPGRNAALLMAAASYAESHGFPTIVLAIVATVSTPWKTVEYPDCSLEFVQAVNSLLQLSAKKHVHVQAPLVDVQKPGVFSLARRLGVDPDDTISCLAGRECGECMSCVERKFAQMA